MQNQITILVADDSPTQVAVLQDALEQKGFIVKTATNGVEAISRINQSPPDLILSDVLMPELNGYHLCRLLKSDPSTADIPIVLLTNLSERHDRFWAENAGADFFLEKSASIDEIVATISQRAKKRARHPESLNGKSPIGQVSSENVHFRIAEILDRLLYESTISNEVLKLTSLAHNLELLVSEFLKFLSAICRHSAGVLLLRHGRSKYLLSTHVTDAMPADFAERAQREILTRAGLDGIQKNTVMPIPVKGEKNLNLPAGEQVHLLHCFKVVDEGELLAFVCLFDREKRKMTPGIRHALSVTADRFTMVARYLKKLTEIEEVKSDFVSMLVHDLRSPLTSIRGFADVLNQEILGGVNLEQKNALKNIQDGSDRLLHLIEGLLSLSKLEAGKMKISCAPMYVGSLITDTAANLAPIFQEKSLKVSVEFDENLPLLSADSHQLARVLTNLLTNAAKFTPSGGEITISAHLETHEISGKDCLEIAVTDTGTGIPLEQQSSLFSRYQQTESNEVVRKGTGLGLAICREIVMLHGGSIWVESPVVNGTGSRFRFTLPFVPPEEEQPSAAGGNG